MNVALLGCSEVDLGGRGVDLGGGVVAVCKGGGGVDLGGAVAAEQAKTKSGGCG